MTVLTVVLNEEEARESKARHKNTIVVADECGQCWSLPVNILNYTPKMALDVYGVDHNGHPRQGYYNAPWDGHYEEPHEYDMSGGRDGFRQRWAAKVGVTLVEA